ncbi:hypothetical protein GEMRC1_006548 [Eukaryota sp. GEM-RC1]
MSSSNVNRILFVRNLPHSATHEELFELFGQFGPIRQLRLGVERNTRGTCFVVYEELEDARVAVKKLSGFLVKGFYLKVGFFNPSMQLQELQDKRRESERKAMTTRLAKEIGSAET